MMTKNQFFSVLGVFALLSAMVFSTNYASWSHVLNHWVSWSLVSTVIFLLGAVLIIALKELKYQKELANFFRRYLSGGAYNHQTKVDEILRGYADEVRLASEGLAAFQKGGLQAQSSASAWSTPLDSLDPEDLAKRFRNEEARLQGNLKQALDLFRHFYDKAKKFQRDTSVTLKNRDWEVYASQEKVSKTA